MFPRGFPPHPPYTTTLIPTPIRLNAHPAFAGHGVVIAFIDSGFYPHPDLGDRVLTHIDASDARITEGRRFARPMWYSWHGQMTSVIACGDGSSSDGFYRGIASRAEMVLVKVSTTSKQIREPDILRGMNWLIAHHRRFNVRIVNISVGGDAPSADPDHPLYRAVRTLIDQGVTVIVAGGNSPSFPLVPPNSAPEAIAIGGYDDENSLDVADWRLYSNSYGHAYEGTPKPDVLAPAAWIPSPILPGTFVEREARWLAPLLDLADGDFDGLRDILKRGWRDLGLTRVEADAPDESVRLKLLEHIREHKIVDSQHQYVGGSSVSAAIATSIVAQMLEANTRLTPLEIKAILIRTAKRLPYAPIEQQGAGVIDASDAVSAAEAFNQANRNLAKQP